MDQRATVVEAPSERTRRTALPKDALRWNVLSKKERSADEDALFEDLQETLGFNAEFSEDSNKPNIDYDAIEQWDYPFEGEVLKEDPPADKPLITLVMMVKNEAATLQATVDSARPVADQVVIGVDDSCTDATEEVALKVADKVFRFTWRDDFAWARNNAITQADGEWILILDGHEELDYSSVPLVRIHVEGAGDKSMIMGTTVMNPQSEDVHGAMFAQPRLFRNMPRHFYKYDTHHQLAGAGDRGTNVMRVPNIRIFHMMPAERAVMRVAQRGKMNIDNLLRAVARDPGDERAVFYLSNSYYEDSDPDTARPWYSYLLEMGQHRGYKYHALMQLATIAGRKLQPDSPEEEQASVLDEIRGYLMEAYALCFYRAETTVRLGSHAEATGNTLEAEHWYKQAAGTKLPADADSLFVNKDCYTWMPWTRLADIYEKQERWEEALTCIEKVAEYKPQEVDVLGKLKMYEQRVRRRKEAKGSRIVLFDQIGSFTTPLIESLMKAGNQLEVYDTFDTRCMEGADAAFFEWGDGNLIKATHHNYRGLKIVARIHRYEPYQGFLRSVDFSKVDHVIFTSEHIQAASNQFAEIPDSCQQHIIPSSIRLDSWTYKEREANKNIAYVGYLNWKKGIPMMLQVLHALKTLGGDDYKLFLYSKFQSPEVEEYLYKVSKGMGVYDMLEWKGWQAPDRLDEAVDADDISYVLNTAITEGCPYSVLEMMAKGIKPIVHQWPGANRVYRGHDEWLFYTPAEAATRIIQGGFTSSAYRDFVAEHHNQEEEFKQIAKLLEAKEVIEDENNEVPREVA